MPDGSEGFSLLVIITADFGTGIQLGFGFTLLAVGGLLGLNRAMLFQPIMDGVRTDAIASVMFPQDVIANAPRIISDLQAFFPPQEGTFLIGPMAKLGWGEPTLISLSLGVIIEIPPGDIAILGVLKLALPADDLRDPRAAGQLRRRDRVRQEAVLLLRRRCSTRTSCSSPSTARWACCSPTATTRTSWCRSAASIRSSIRRRCRSRRRSASSSTSSTSRTRAFTADGYFAVTTNTVQFGTHASYFFGFSALSVEGSSGFDALIQFSPFHFTVTISTSVLGQGVRPRRLRRRHRRSRSKARRRGTRTAPRRCRSSSSRSTSASTSPGAKTQTPRCRRSR